MCRLATVPFAILCAKLACLAHRHGCIHAKDANDTQFFCTTTIFIVCVMYMSGWGRAGFNVQAGHCPFCHSVCHKAHSQQL